MLPCQQPEIIHYSSRLAASFTRWIGLKLVDADNSTADLAQKLYHAPFVLAAHGVERDPLFCYANLAAQNLWGMPWEEWMGLPSRRTAEPDAQGERERLLERGQKNGYVNNYQGVRITKSGRRFRIMNTVLWNIIDERGMRIGQAAMFDRWEWL